MIQKSFFLISVAIALLGTVAIAEEIRIEGSLVDTALTITEIARANGISEAKLLKGLKLAPAAASLKLPQTGRSIGQASTVIRKLKVLQATEKSKDWRLIVAKFALWIIGLATATVLLTKNKINGRIRLIWMVGTALLFGFIFGSDPNPMGTVKDAIVLFGLEGVIFPPRMAALGAFLIFVLVSNKSICGWGCHFGALQDTLHYIPLKKIKLPFWITNGIRLAISISIVLWAFIWRFDWVGDVDPFKIFNVTAWQMSLAGMVFISALLLTSLFIYRPWCQMFCPFGLAGWLAEQFSILSPRINRGGCLKCQKCVRVCPTQAMDGIYHGKKFRADCFACGKCISECPAKAIDWRTAYKNDKILEENT